MPNIYLETYGDLLVDKAELVDNINRDIAE